MATAQERFEADRKFTYRALQDARQYVTDVDHTGAKAEALYERLAKANRIMHPWSTDGNETQSQKAIEYIREITSILSDKIGPASRREFREQGGRRAHATKKSPAQLQREIDEALETSEMTPAQRTQYKKGRQWGLPAQLSFKAATGRPLEGARSPWKPRPAKGHATVWTERPGEITSTAGLMKIAAAVARELKQSGMTWGDTSRAQGRAVRIWSSGTSVRFEVPGRFQGVPSDAQAIVELLLVGPDRSKTSVGPFAGDQHYDKRFGEAMEQRVRQVLKKGAR